MRRKSMVSLQVFCFFLGLFSSALEASSLSRGIVVSKRATTSHFSVKDERHFEFDIELDRMARLDVQSSVDKFSPKELKKDGLAHYDIDGTYQKMTKDDRLVIRRIAYLLPHKSPSDFSAKQYSSDSFSRALLGYDRLLSKSSTSLSFMKTSHDHDLRIELDLAEYDVTRSKAFNMGSDEISKLLKIAPKVRGASLEKIVRAASSPRDVVDVTDGGRTYPSYGGRTSYFFYSVPGGHTLQYSVKVMSFKKSSFKGATWNAIKLGVVMNEKGRVKKSVEKFRELVCH